MKCIRCGACCQIFDGIALITKDLQHHTLSFYKAEAVYGRLQIRIEGMKKNALSFEGVK